MWYNVQMSESVHILDITSKDIGKLSPGNLQELVGRLCEAELVASGMPLKDAIYSINIYKPDGGVDVRVNNQPGLSGFIPQKNTIFQIKQSDLRQGKGKIAQEMHGASNRLRQAIADTLQSGGAYLFVSGKESLNDTDIRERKRQMAEIVDEDKTIKGADTILDFYDGGRIAQWVRYYPHMALWIHAKTGNVRVGWLPYGNWSDPRSQNGESDYRTDNLVYLIDRNSEDKTVIPIDKGIDIIRTKARESGSAVRIVGLSGMGKTRMVQALFDSKIGEKEPLNKYEAVYANIQSDITPPPVIFARILAALNKPTVLIADNCGRDMHRQLANVCCRKNSPVKLITVDLDVRDDIPEGTGVFQLKSQSEGLVEDLLAQRYPQVSEINRMEIAKLCGGNPGMGLLIAEPLSRAKNSENLGILRDNQLIERLLRQKHGPNAGLMTTAEVCSLVKSFSVHNKKDGELTVLASLAGKTAKEIYRDAATLAERGIIQKRDIMRAVLPDALANTLAARALTKISCEEIVRAFEKPVNERLLLSFAKRLQYLHESGETQSIVRKWFTPGRQLDLSAYQPHDLPMDMLESVAPVLPPLTLEAIERGANNGSIISPENPYLHRFERLLGRLAYGADMFDRAADLLCRLAPLDSRSRSDNEAPEVLRSLFQYSYSGTLASPQQRLDFIKKLMMSDCAKKKTLGKNLLDATLTPRLSSIWNYDFGARSRDFGYIQQGQQSVREWFALFIDYTSELAASNSDIASATRTLLANRFRELWSIGLDSELDPVIQIASRQSGWEEMPPAILHTIRFDGDDMPADRRARLLAIKNAFSLDTKNPRKMFNLFFVHDKNLALSYADLDGHAAGRAQIQEKIREIGAQIARSDTDFKALLPIMLTTSHHELFTLGNGLAEGCGDYLRMWEDFRGQLPLLENPNLSAMGGFLSAVAQRKPGIAGKILERTITDPLLSHAYPRIEVIARLREGAVDRIKRSIDFGKAPVYGYSYLANGGYHEIFSDSELVQIIRSILSRDGGMETAVDILYMRTYQSSPGALIVKCCRDLVLQNDFSPQQEHYKLASVIDSSFGGACAEDASKALCRKLVSGLSPDGKINSSEVHNVLRSLTRLHPTIFLDEFLIQEADSYGFGLAAIASAISQIEDDVVVNWCEKNTGERYPRVAAVVQAHRPGKDGERKEWTPLARRIIEAAPDKVKVLDTLLKWRSVEGHVGPLSEMFKKDMPLFAELKEHKHPAVAEWARTMEEYLKKDIRREIEHEKNEASYPSGFE